MSEIKKRKKLNDPKTKAKILDAAQTVFSKKGYSLAGIRDIAAQADVSSALIIRYFGSKPALFEAALIEAVPLDLVIGEVPRDEFGAFVVNLVKSPATEAPIVSMIALSISDTQARESCIKILQSHLLPQLVAWLGAPNAKIRAIEILMLFMGFLFYTRYMPLLPQTKLVDRRLTKWCARVLQEIVDQSK